MMEVTTQLAEFDELPADAARDLVRPACSSEVWVQAIVDARPYRSVDGLLAHSDRTIAALAWADVEQALAAHPRIGERAGGADQESAWSRQEQAAVVSVGDDVTAALHRANVDYEQRFGHVFLICATGRSAEQMLGALHERIDNEPADEQDIVRRELAAIARLRLAKVIR